MLEVIIKETHTRSQRTCILVFLKKLQQTHSLQCMLYGSEQSHIPWGKKKKKTNLVSFAEVRHKT